MKFCDEKIQKHLLNGGKIKRRSCNFPMLLSNNGSFCYKCDYIHSYCLSKQDLTADDWEIIEPEYDWDKIIKDKVLCVFEDMFNVEDLDCDYPILGYLLNYDFNEDYKFECKMIENRKAHFGKCKPFNPTEFNIAEDLKEYEK